MISLKDIPKLVINLESRQDRLMLVKKELDGLGAFIMPGFTNNNPLKGIAQAHINCIRHAKDQQWPAVLIMEDDVVFRSGFKEYLDDAFKVIPIDWEVLLSGVYEENNLQPINEYWDRSGEFCGLHFYIVNEIAYDKILSYDHQCNQHIDRWMNYGGKRLNTYITKKYVAYQRDGYSDNSKSQTYYNDLLLNKKKLL